MRRWIILLIGLLVSIGVQAQETTNYRLRVPNAEEYLQSIPDIFASWKKDWQDYYESFDPLVTTLGDEIVLRYSNLEAESFADLYTAYTTMAQESGSYSTGVEKGYWNKAIIIAWLRENDIDLAKEELLEFEDYHIEIEGRDFNADGQNEWLLDVTRVNDSAWEGYVDYQQFLVLEADRENYRVVDSPLLWFGDGYHYASYHSGLIKEQYFGDMNGNGLPEWVLSVGGIGGGNQSYGFLYVLEWYDGQLIDLAPQYTDWEDQRKNLSYSAVAGGWTADRVFPIGVDLEFADADENPNTIEILVLQDFVDTWGCDFSEVRTFTRENELFALIDTTRDYNDSAQCALRFGQTAMWDEDYETAIPLLEHSLELFAEMELPDDAGDYTIQLKIGTEAYVGVRLSLAYALTGRTADAVELLDSLTPPDDFPPMTALVENAQNSFVNENVFDLCVAMHDTFVEYHRREAQYANPYWGVTLDVPSPIFAPGSSAPGPDHGHAGCDIEKMLEDSIADVEFATTDSPIDTLAVQNVTVLEEFHMDFNEDDISDWLIWYSRYLKPLVFLSDGETFSLSRSSWTPGYPDEFTTLQEWELPNGKSALLTYRYDTRPQEIRRMEITGGPLPMCKIGEEEIVPRGRLELWQVEDDEFDPVNFVSLCESADLEEIFPDGIGSTELVAWASLIFDDNAGIYEPMEPAIFIWDDEDEKYILQDNDEEDEDKTETEPINTNTRSCNSSDLYRIKNTFRSGDYESAITAARECIEIMDTEMPDIQRYEIIYYLALSLEFAGQEDLALAEYIAIYETAPESAWGMLAALHIEPIE